MVFPGPPPPYLGSDSPYHPHNMADVTKLNKTLLLPQKREKERGGGGRHAQYGMLTIFLFVWNCEVPYFRRMRTKYNFTFCASFYKNLHSFFSGSGKWLTSEFYNCIHGDFCPCNFVCFHFVPVICLWWWVCEFVESVILLSPLRCWVCDDDESVMLPYRIRDFVESFILLRLWCSWVLIALSLWYCGVRYVVVSLPVLVRYYISVASIPLRKP